MTNSERKLAEKISIIKRKKSRANTTDVVLFILLIIIALNNQSVDTAIWYLVLGTYLLILLPVMLMITGTPGQMMSGLYVRKDSDPSKYIGIKDSYTRIVTTIIKGITGKSKEIDDPKVTVGDSILIDRESDLTEDEALKHEAQKAKLNFAFAAIIYIGWVIWLGNYWFLLGLPIIFDIYISRKVNWTPWKRRDGNNHWLVEWLDALIFAVVAVTIINYFLFQNYKIPTGSMEKSLLVGDFLYVSKVAYGPRIPQTPLSIPFMQNTIPGTEAKSYSELIKLPYKRLAGFGEVERNDPVVFNFPAGDTVLDQIALQQTSFYHHIRMRAEDLKKLDRVNKKPMKTEEEYYNLSRSEILRRHEIFLRPVDKRDNYIKRCVGVPGDSLEIIMGEVHVNGKPQDEIPGIQYEYILQTDGRRLNPKRMEELGINKEYYSDERYSHNWTLTLPLTDHMAEELEKNVFVTQIQPLIRQPEYYDFQMFPFDERYPWNLDNFGPIYIPKKGATVEINMESLPFYERIIDQYEANDLEVKDSTIYINGEVATNYTFKMDYYWMMGDNRHKSLDSRYWGYVPEDHIVGKPKFIWLSLNQDKSFPANIRFKRIFTGIK